MNTSAKAVVRLAVARELDRIERASANPPKSSTHEAEAIFMNAREQSPGLTPEQVERSKKKYGV